MTYLQIELIICFFGILPLFFLNRFKTMRFLGAIGIASGCVAGFVLSALNLYSGNTATFPYRLPIGLSFSFALDPLSTFFLVPLFLVGAMVSVYSYHYLEDQQKRTRIGLHYFFLALLIVSMTGVVLAGSMISFAFFWEAMSVTSAALVLFDYDKDNNRRATFRYFIYTQAGGLAIFASFGLLFAVNSTFEFLVPEAVSSGLRLTIFLLAMIGFGSKAGFMPLHVWLPYAHPAAPSHISALMSGVMIKLGLYGLLRMFIILNPDPAIIGRIFIIVGSVSGVLGIVYALGQQNLKRLLAYSSIENMGIILLGCGIGFVGMANRNTPMAMLGFAGGLLHVWNHSLFKSVLFLGVGCVQHGAGTLVMDRLGGLLKKMTKTGTIFLVGTLAICGLPPLNGFVSEFLIYMAGFQGIGEQRLDLLFIVLVILSLAVIGGLAIACFTMVFGVVFLGEPRHTVSHEIHEAKGTMILPMSVLVLFCVVIGLVPNLFVKPSLAVAAMFIDGIPAVSYPYLTFCRNISLGGAFFIVLFFLLYLLLSFFYRGKVVSFGPTWGCGFSRSTTRIQYTASSFARSIIELFQPLTLLKEEQSKIVALFPAGITYHSKALDIFEQFGDRCIARPLFWCTTRLRRIQHGNIQLYIAYIVLAVIILLILQIW